MGRKMQESKILYVFDFDDTLVTCDAKVKITKPNGDVIFLKAIEFSEYIYGGWPKGDLIDHTDFWEYPPNGRWVAWTKNRLDTVLEDDNCMIAIITGRERLEPIIMWMIENLGKQKTERIAFHSTDAKPKEKKYREVLKNISSLERVVIYEDSQEALDDMLTVCQEMGIKYSGYKISKSIINAKDYEEVNYVCVEAV
jgi:hypothetical protein